MSDLIPPNAAESIMTKEGFRPGVYKCTGGHDTIGYGTLLPITTAEAQFLLQHRLKVMCIQLDKRIRWWRRLDNARQVILANMAYQMGVHGLLGFRKMLAALQDKDWYEASVQALDSEWARQTKERAEWSAEVLRTGRLT